MAASIFPKDIAGGQEGREREEVELAVQFRAGKMHKDGRLCRADPRKGLIFLKKGEDQLTHFCWKDRTTGAIDDDLIVFPEEAEFKLVSQCMTGRVYVLTFKSSDRKLFFWMQEPKKENDEDWCRRVNQFMNDTMSMDEGTLDETNPAVRHLSELSAVIGMPEEQILAMLGVRTPRTNRNSSDEHATRTTSGSTQDTQRPRSPVPPPSTATSASPISSTPQIAAAAAAGSSNTASTMPIDSLAPVGQSGFDISTTEKTLSQLSSSSSSSSSMINDIDLSQILTPDNLRPLLENPRIQQRLFPFLPPKASHTQEELHEIIRSPPFIQAIRALDMVLRSSEAVSLLLELNLDPSILSSNQGALGLLPVLHALQAKHGSSSNPSSSSKENTTMDET